MMNVTKYLKVYILFFVWHSMVHSYSSDPSPMVDSTRRRMALGM